jgi:3-oxoacyl-[acyl-carrier-protein] synthase-3
MGTTFDAVRYTTGHGLHGTSARRLTDTAALQCLAAGHTAPEDVDLLINAGLYRDRNLGEPALAALIQEDLGINPQDPGVIGHGSFSFDVANGAAGVLVGAQIAARFLRARTINRALIVTADADPGHGMAPGFPFRAAGGAVLCGYNDSDRGLGDVLWRTWHDGGETWRATVGFHDGHNSLDIVTDESFYRQAGVVAAKVAVEVLASSGLAAHDVAVVVAAPANAEFVAALSEHSGIDDERFVIGGDQRLHTVAFVAALDRARSAGLLTRNGTALLVCAGSGITAGAAVYRT